MKPGRENAAGIHIGAGLSGYVASIGQCLVCADLGLPGELHDNHASYIEHWLRILKGDASAIIHAASKAEQAFNYLKAFRSPEESCDAENQRATAVEEPA